MRVERWKSTLKHLKMFPEDFIRTSVMLVVSKCFNAMSQTQLVGSLKHHAGSDEEVLTTLNLVGGKVTQLLFVLNEYAVNDFGQQVRRVIEMAAAMEARKPHPVNMEMALSELAKMELIPIWFQMIIMCLAIFALFDDSITGMFVV